MASGDEEGIPEECEEEDSHHAVDGEDSAPDPSNPWLAEKNSRKTSPVSSVSFDADLG